MLLWCRRSRCSRIAHGVSSQKPQAKAIVERAAQPAPRVTSSIPGYTAWKVNTIDAHVHIFFVVSTTLTTLGAGKRKKNQNMDTICLCELLWGGRVGGEELGSLPQTVLVKLRDSRPDTAVFRRVCFQGWLLADVWELDLSNAACSVLPAWDTEA